jgi:NAD(P)-dependent dehydrogenase (short-subunit alcohol dehydrogenase family)
MAVDRDLASAEETVSMVKQGGSECFAFEADVTKEATLAAAIAAAQKRWSRIDILHYNVGVSIAGGDAPLRRKMGTAWDVANAALFLASDEANFVTGVALLVDSGAALNVG